MGYSRYTHPKQALHWYCRAHVGILTRLFVALGLALSLPSVAMALSVKSVSIEETLDKSALIFEGRVVGSETRAVENSKMILSCFEIVVADVLKGSDPGTSLDLCFLGGTLEGRTISVPGMRYPLLGETGIYFVEAPGHIQVHPLYGGDQGHFLVERDGASGKEHVVTLDRLPVTKVSASAGQANSGLSAGVARGIGTAQERGLAMAMTKTAFKESLQEMLDGPLP